MGFSAAFSEKYEVVRTLGQGGMGQVLLAKSRSDGRSVAIKVIAAHSFSGHETRQRFLMEAAVTARLNHPAIVRVIEHGTDGDQLYIVLELIGGGDLATLVKQGPLAPAVFWRLALPLVDGFSHAHSQGVLHRDIKPANVLLDEAGSPRIADFGIAKDLAGGGVRTATGLVMGTPAYMAPELAKGQRATALSDQYALGVLFYELLTGVRPFQADEPLALLRMHIEDAVPNFGSLRSDAPPGLEALVRRMLEKEPAARYPDLAAVKAELEALRASAGDTWRRRTTRRTRNTVAVTAASMPSPGAAPSRWIPAVAVGLLTLVAGAWLALRPKPAPATAPQVSVRVLRQIERVRVSWDPPERALHAVVRFDGTSRAASQVTSLELDRMPERAVAAELELTFPGGTVKQPLTFGSVSVAGVVADLSKLRLAGWESKKEREAVACAEFGRAMTAKGYEFTDRHPPLEQLPARAAAASRASGLSALIDQHRAGGLVELLERAASVLDLNTTSPDQALAILGHVHALVELHTLADLHGLIHENEPLRFLYACGPGPMETGRGHVLRGAGDFRRSRWRLRLMERGEGTHSVDAYFGPAEEPLRKELQRWVAKQKIHKFTGSGENELLAVEYRDDQAALGDDESLAGKKWSSEPFRVELMPAASEYPQFAEVVMHVQTSDRTHVDVMVEKDRAAEPLCFRFPTRYRDHMTREKEAYLVWQVPARALEHRGKFEVWLRAHCAPGEGRFRDVYAKQFHAWEAEVPWVFVNFAKDPRDHFAR